MAAAASVRFLRPIRASFTDSHGIYGAPRGFLDLREAGGVTRVLLSVATTRWSRVQESPTPSVPFVGPRAWYGVAQHTVQTALLLFCVVIVTVPADAQTTPFDADSRTRGLVGGWGHSWRAGVPGFGKTRSEITFVAFHPQLGWFVTDDLELYGEATLLAYFRPDVGVSAGLGAIAGRYHLRSHGKWIPYLNLGAGVLWTSLTVPEIDRVFNFQVFFGAGLRHVGKRNPGWMIEFRNHHVSNAGTAGKNLGVNAATLLAGVEWILR